MFCTTCHHTIHDQNILTGCQLHPLKAPCLKAIKRELRPIRQSQTFPLRHSAKLCDTLSAAIKVLTEPDSFRDQTLSVDRSHVFVLSPYPAECLVAVQDLASLRTHLICPALIPSSVNDDSGNGWHLSLGFPAPTDEATQHSDILGTLVKNLQTVIAHARTQLSPGSIADVNVKVNPAAGAVVETVLGASSSSVLRPGQVLSMFVEVNVEAVSQTYTPSPLGPSPRDSGIDLADAFSELEIMLGETLADLFTVEVWYKHSLFPNTDLVINETCRVRRYDPSSEWNSRIIPDGFAQTIKNKHVHSEVQKRLARFVCSQYTPEASLTKLDELFFTQDCSLSCPDYLDSLREELFYQLHVLQNVDGINVETSSEAPYQPSPDLGRSSFEKRSSQFLNIQEDPALRRSSSGSPTTVIHTRNTEYKPEESPDQAKKIWRHMRKDSRGRQHPLMERSEDSLNRIADEDLEAIKERAVQNKRSVGADTLRSLAISAGAGTLAENYAPWS